MHRQKKKGSGRASRGGGDALWPRSPGDRAHKPGAFTEPSPLEMDLDRGQALGGGAGSGGNKEHCTECALDGH